MDLNEFIQLNKNLSKEFDLYKFNDEKRREDIGKQYQKELISLH